MNAETREICDRATNSVIERLFADDQIEARLDFTIFEWKVAAIARSVSPDDNVSPHAPSASASPMIFKIPNACS
jgi:hypothetical protein